MIEPMLYRTQGEYSNHYATDADKLLFVQWEKNLDLSLKFI